VLGAWSLVRSWSVVRAWSLVRCPPSRDQGPRTKYGLRTKDGPRTTNQVLRTSRGRELADDFTSGGLNFDPFGSFLNVELTMRGCRPVFDGGDNGQIVVPKSECAAKYSVITAFS
jgi:hypothetical protein